MNATQFLAERHAVTRAKLSGVRPFHFERMKAERMKAHSIWGFSPDGRKREIGEFTATTT
jgi:hypothetical protein